MKFARDRTYSDPEKAARKLLEIATTSKATPEEYKAGLDLAIERGWLGLHESGTFVRFTRSGADLV